MLHMDINDEETFELLRSSRERVRLSRDLEEDVLDTILRTQELVRQSYLILHSGESSAVMKFHQDSHLPAATSSLLIP